MTDFISKYAVLIAVGVVVIIIGATAYFTHSYDMSQLQNNLNHASSGSYDTTYHTQTPIVIGDIRVVKHGDRFPRPDGYLDLDSLELAMRKNKENPSQETSDSSPFGGDTTIATTVTIDGKDTVIYVKATVIADPVSKMVFADVQIPPINRPPMPVINHIEFVLEPVAWYAKPSVVAPTFFTIGGAVVYFLLQSTR